MTEEQPKKHNKYYCSYYAIAFLFALMFTSGWFA